MPFFFQFSKNGRRADGTPGTKCAALNNSTMNDLCALVSGRKEDGGLKQDINMNFKEVDNFNYRMLMSHVESKTNVEVRQVYLDEIAKVQSGLMEIVSDGEIDDYIAGINMKMQLACGKIIKEIEKICSLEEAYDTFVVDLYAGKNLDKVSYKNYFWMIFGDIAERNLTYNLKHCHKCEKCGQMIPDWDDDHQHQGEDNLHFQCKDCGKVFDLMFGKGNKEIRCFDCNKRYLNQRKTAEQKARRQKETAEKRRREMMRRLQKGEML